MKKLMTHLVVGSPDMATSKRMIKYMAEREVAAVELQIPFSDPIADGPVLMAANERAVRRGVSVEETLKLIEEMNFGQTKLFLMSYFQPVFGFGLEKFFDRAIKAGCKGFIIPDLPFDAPEVGELTRRIPELKRKLVPVLSPGMTPKRLEELFGLLTPDLVYLTARQGITGQHSKLSGELSKTIASVRKHTTAEIAVGFGIQTAADVRSVLDSGADLAVVGSALAKALNQSEDRALALLEELRKAA